MLRKVTSTFLMLLCSWLALGPLAVMQIGAWSWMLGSYSQESSLEQAIRETFSGERPCELCQLIEDVKDEQPGPSQTSPSKKLKLMLGLARPVTIARQEPNDYRPIYQNDPLIDYQKSVPTPPPRSA